MLTDSEKSKLTTYDSKCLLEDFLREIPKSDLHVHLDGSLRFETILEISKEKGIELPNPDDLKARCFSGGFTSLEHYLEGFKYTVAVMQDAPSMERIAYEFAVDNYTEGVRYFEVRFAPQLHASIHPQDNFNIMDVFSAVNNGLKRARDEFNSRIVEGSLEPNFEYGIIACAMRTFFPGMSRYYDALFSIYVNEPIDYIVGVASEILIKNCIQCIEQRGVPIVALDVAGPESGYKNNVHRNAFDFAHSHFLNKTVHAGEGYGPESIFQAVRDLHCDRIGHGFHLFHKELIQSERNKNDPGYIDRLVKYICDRRINIEVCLTSNLDTMPGLVLKDHAIGLMLKNHVSVTINTDNRLVSNTNTIKELQLAIETFKLSPKQVFEIVIDGFKRSFYPGSYNERRVFVRQCINYFYAIAEKYGIACPIR